MSVADTTDPKERTRRTWAAGDYPAVARSQLWPVGERIVRRLAVAPGERVLDVACGTGNAAIRAAQAGGVVTGVDLTPELFDAARAGAAEAGVEVTWVEGDAEALPVGDAEFDVVVSTFGCMFAPDHGLAARELVRVLRVGGRLGVTAWTPDGAVGRSFATMGRYAPPPPPGFQPPTLWGAESHVRELFAGTGVELAFERETVSSTWPHDTPEANVEWLTQVFGPLAGLRTACEADGTWSELRAELVGFVAADQPGEYLVTLGRRA